MTLIDNLDYPFSNEIRKISIPACKLRKIDLSLFHCVTLPDEPGNCKIYIRDPDKEEQIIKLFTNRNKHEQARDKEKGKPVDNTRLESDGDQRDDAIL